jgi:ribosome-associated translation inhibitor RaiA
METVNFCNANGARVISDQDLPDSITEMIQQQTDRIQREYSYILNCKVDVIVPEFYQTGTYQVQIILNLPNLELKIDREPTPDCYQEDIYVAIWSAFDLARKKLRERSLLLDSRIAASPTKIQHPPIRGIRRSRGYAQG